VKSLMLLDGGWPRSQQTSDKPVQISEASKAGIERALSRLNKNFGSLDELLLFWFPNGSVSIESLMASPHKHEEIDYLEALAFDLGPSRTEANKMQPKCIDQAFLQDYTLVGTTALTEEEMKTITAPVMFVRAGRGFFTEAPPLISAETMERIKSNLKVQLYIELCSHNHYNMVVREAAEVIANSAASFIRRPFVPRG